MEKMQKARRTRLIKKAIVLLDQIDSDINKLDSDIKAKRLKKTA